MPKPTTTTEGRDYGKRLYVSRQAYQKQMRRLTDAHRDRGASVPHSESKKPYLPDQSYQEMEYFDYPWDGPNFPGYPGFPDDPGINNDPEVNGFHAGPNDPPKDPHSEFLGCDFWWPFQPPVVSSGEYAVGRAFVTDDSITGFEVVGPAHITVSGVCTKGDVIARRRSPYPNQGCIVIVWINKKIDWDKWGTDVDTGMGAVTVIAHTASGGSCSSSVSIRRCTGEEDPFEWDADTSAETILQNGAAGIAVEGGLGPFTWSVSGTGFSVSVEKTNADTRTNILNANGSACGTAVITVEDTCGNTATGYIRCTDSGTWSAVSGCVAGGAADSSTWPQAWGSHERTENQYKCTSVYGLADANFYGWEGDEWVGCSGCDSRCTSVTECNTTGTGCNPCVQASVDGGGTFSGTPPCCERVSTGALRCCCEQAYNCYEWICS